MPRHNNNNNNSTPRQQLRVWDKITLCAFVELARCRNADAWFDSAEVQGAAARLIVTARSRVCSSPSPETVHRAVCACMRRFVAVGIVEVRLEAPVRQFKLVQSCLVGELCAAVCGEVFCGSNCSSAVRLRTEEAYKAILDAYNDEQNFVPSCSIAVPTQLNAFCKLTLYALNELTTAWPSPGVTALAVNEKAIRLLHNGLAPSIEQYTSVNTTTITSFLTALAEVNIIVVTVLESCGYPRSLLHYTYNFVPSSLVVQLCLALTTEANTCGFSTSSNEHSVRTDNAYREIVNCGHIELGLVDSCYWRSQNILENLGKLVLCALDSVSSNSLNTWASSDSIALKTKQLLRNGFVPQLGRTLSPTVTLAAMEQFLGALVRAGVLCRSRRPERALYQHVNAYKFSTTMPGIVQFCLALRSEIDCGILSLNSPQNSVTQEAYRILMGFETPANPLRRSVDLESIYQQRVEQTLLDSNKQKS